MKTFAAVLCAMLATAGMAFAHGTGGGGAAAGGPVISPISMPVMAPIAGTPVQSGPTQFGSPVYTPSRPSLTDDNDRRHKKPVANQQAGLFYAWDTKICRPSQWLLTPSGAMVLSSPYPCDINSNYVASLIGPVPYWLPPAFLW